MNSMSSKKERKTEKFVPEWIWEVLLVVGVTPAIVHAILTVNSLPIV